MAKPDERTLNGSQRGRAWRAVYTREDRFVVKSVKAEVAAAQWMAMGRPPEASFASETEMLRGIERNLEERFSR